MIMWHHQRLSQLAALVLLMSSRIVGISSGRLPGYMRDEAFIGYSEAYLDGYSELLVFSTRYGDIKVKFFGQASPKTVRYLKSLVAKGMFDGCAFYRAEAPGETYDEGHEDPRKGYALLQGGLYSCGKQQVNLLPVETLVPNRKGTISLITKTSREGWSIKNRMCNVSWAIRTKPLMLSGLQKSSDLFNQQQGYLKTFGEK